jgi:hypothetical protein
MQRGRWNDAREPAQRLLELTDGAPEALQLMKQIEMAESAR